MRVFAHIDVDAFYAQAEEIRSPQLRGKPVGVTQKYLVVTCNYLARERGVGKLMSIANAKKTCPELVLVSGEDLTPYRQASARIRAIISSYGPISALGMEEMCVDLTDHLAKHPLSPRCFAGHIIGDADCEDTTPSRQPRERKLALLKAASHLTAEIRAQIRQETQFHVSAGIAHSRVLAKMVCGCHKPNDQTSLPSHSMNAFLCNRPVRDIPGCGRQTSKVLKTHSVETIGQLRGFPEAKLRELFGGRVCAILLNGALGKDHASATPPVKDQQCGPSTISVEDSFKGISMLRDAEVLLRDTLAPDLAIRVWENAHQTGMWPQTLTVAWRFRQVDRDGKTRYNPHRKSRSGTCPSVTRVTSRRDTTGEELARAIGDETVRMLCEGVNPPFCMTLLSIAVGGISVQVPRLKAVAGTKLALLMSSEQTGSGKRSRRLQEEEEEEDCRGRRDPTLSLGDGTLHTSGVGEESWERVSVKSDSSGSMAGGGCEEWDAILECDVSDTIQRTTDPLSLSLSEGAYHTGLPPHQNVIDVNEKQGMNWCVRCNATVSDAQEHADFHLALALAAEDRHPSKRKLVDLHMSSPVKPQKRPATTQQTLHRFFKRS